MNLPAVTTLSEATLIMNFKNILIAVLLLISIILFVLPVYPQDNEIDNDASSTIGPGDLIDIKVFNVPELNITVRVSGNGTVTLPLIGNIMAEGLTRSRLEQRLANELEKSYLKNAQVTVFIKEYHSKMVSVIGAVKKPGNQELYGEKTILELISLAGGFTPDASKKIIIIRKLKEGKSISLTIDMDELMLEGNPKLNIPLQAGDIINIPAESHMNIYIFGEVKNPGHIEMIREGEITLLRAIAQAGGFTERARKGSVLVKRRENGKEKKIKINVKSILRGKKPDFILENNDIIHVPESFL